MAQTKRARKSNPLARLLAILGPGFITGASDDDPSGIGTYVVAGASFGFATLWTALITFPLMAGVQFICAKLAKVTGRGLAGVLKKHYPPWLVYPVVISLVLANTINAGADIGAIAAAINMLVPIPIIAMIVPITATLLALQFWGSYKLIERTFKWLTLALFAYVATAFFTHPGSGEVLKGSFIPAVKFDGKFLALLLRFWVRRFRLICSSGRLGRKLRRKKESAARGSSIAKARRSARSANPPWTSPSGCCSQTW